jgi:hypothetical protein
VPGVRCQGLNSGLGTRGRRGKGGQRRLPPRVTNCPASAIGRSEPQDEGRIPPECRGLTISSVAHTSPYRLSASSGETVNQFDGIENHKSKISNHPMTR